MVELEIRLDERHAAALNELLREFPDRAGRTLVRAINRVAAKLRTQVKRAIGRESTVKAGVVAQRMRLYRATPAQPGAKLGLGGKPIRAFDFKPRPAKPPRRPPPVGASYELLRGQRRTVAGAFVARMQSGHVGLWRRRGARRHPLEEIMGPSLSALVERSPALGAGRLEADAGDDLEQALRSQLEWLLAQRAGGAEPA